MAAIHAKIIRDRPEPLMVTRAYGVKRMLREGVELAHMKGYYTKELDGDHVTISGALWALTEDAARVHGGGYWMPRQRGIYWPQVFRTAEEIWEASRFEQASGDIPTSCAPPSASEIQRADAVHEMWREKALPRLATRAKLMKAIWLYASGVKSGRINRDMGLNRRRLHDARIKALVDLEKALDKTDKT